MKKLFLTFALALVLCSLFVLAVSAAATDEFGQVETSTTIDLTNMAEDDDVYCVLFDGTEYHTYPSRYIVTNATTMTWKFDNINSAFSKKYTASSIIRLQVPAHVTTIPCITQNYFSWNFVTTLKEVSFPKDTQVTTFAWGAFEKCPGLESFVVPNTVTKFDGVNTFNGCSGLKSIVFEEGCQITHFPRLAFGGTINLTEFIMPPSITSIDEGILGGHGCKLTRVVLSPNLSKVTAGGLLTAVCRDPAMFAEIYMPASFATGEGSAQSGSIIGRNDNNDLQRYAIFFTGTKDEAIALVTKYSGDICLSNANIVPFDPSKSSGLDYIGMEPYTSDIQVNSNRVIIYGCNPCFAFYNNEHQMSGSDIPVVTSYFEEISVGNVCTREGCGEGISSATVLPIFEYLGFSYTEAPINGVYSMCQSYKINRTELEKYTVYSNKPFEFGVVASTVDNPLSLESQGLTGRVLINRNMVGDCFDIKISAISESNLFSPLVLCAYVIDGEDTYYLHNGKTLSSITVQSLNEVKMK